MLQDCATSLLQPYVCDHLDRRRAKQDERLDRQTHAACVGESHATLTLLRSRCGERSPSSYVIEFQIPPGAIDLIIENILSEVSFGYLEHARVWHLSSTTNERRRRSSRRKHTIALVLQHPLSSLRGHEDDRPVSLVLSLLLTVF